MTRNTEPLSLCPLRRHTTRCHLVGFVVLSPLLSPCFVLERKDGCGKSPLSHYGPFKLFQLAVCIVIVHENLRCAHMRGAKFIRIPTSIATTFRKKMLALRVMDRL